jgi:hypothetical protein
MDYFFRVIRDNQVTVLVDSGYHPGALAPRPGRECLIPPGEALERTGIAPEAVSDVIVTHFDGNCLVERMFSRADARAGIAGWLRRHWRDG